jgi:hypothetical protein
MAGGGGSITGGLDRKGFVGSLHAGCVCRVYMLSVYDG